MTRRLVAHIIELLRSEYSFTSAAKTVNLSVSTVIRVFVCWKSVRIIMVNFLKAVIRIFYTMKSVIM
jgi:hypothetical protein